MKLRVRDVVDSTGAVLARGEAERPLQGVSTDTRTLRPRELFLALHGPNFDGNRFAARAAELGAAALLLRGTPGAPPAELAALPADLPVLLHETPQRALADLASWHRARLDAHVIGVTGSCGKTTTKNVLAQLLRKHLRTVASPASFNNEIGVPHTLLLADGDTQALVVEVGTNHPGEIAALCRVARPTAGIVTNVGASHLEGLGSLEGVAREKSDLFASLPPSGFAVLNLDCRFAATLRAAARCRVITYSVEGSGRERGDLDATEPWFHAGGTTFVLEGRRITIPLLGIHNVSNVLAALGVCRGLGIPLEALLEELTRLEGGRRRMERREVGEVTVYDDSYNANPESALAAVRVLSGLHGRGRRVLVLGDMLELGASAPELHFQVGREAAGSGVELLVLVGELTRATAAGALEAGMDAARVVHLDSMQQASDAIGELLRPGDVALFKGSRRMGLERLIERLERPTVGAR